MPPESLDALILTKESPGPPRFTVLFLHGKGGNGEDLLPIASAWRRRMPEAEFVLPRAPFPSDEQCPGHDQRQWFSLGDWSDATLSDGVRGVAPIIETTLRRVMERRPGDEKRLIFAGISQGAMLATHLALTGAFPVSGVLAYSGIALPVASSNVLRRRPPVRFIHGWLDDLIPPERTMGSLRSLQRSGVPVSLSVIGDMGHSPNEKAIDEGCAFLAELAGSDVADGL